MAKVAQYGSTSGFNIQIYDMSGGGYYAVLYEGLTQVFQRRNNGSGQDTHITVSGVAAWYPDRFLSYSYDSVNKILTLNNCLITHQGVSFFVSMQFKFISDYNIKETWTILADRDGATIDFTNWCYYSSINAVWNTDNINFGDGTSNNSLGFGVQLVNGGSIYGVIADNSANNQNNNAKRSLASQSGIAVTWINSLFALTASVNNRTLSLTQYYFKSTNTLYDFMLQATNAVVADKGYTGTFWGKVSQFTAYMNLALLTDLVTPKVLPSLFYASSGVYMRDSFWTAFMLDNTTEQALITLFETKQNANGNIAERINNDGTTLFYDNESVLLYIIRAFYDRQFRGLTISTTAVRNALTYIASKVVSDQFRITSANAGANKTWMDGFIYTTDSYCGYNQGLYCLALKCAQALGLSVTDTQIAGAKQVYQSMYDPSLTFMKFASDKSFLSPDVLVGEALSLFLFNQPLLTDQAVNNTVAAMRSVGNTTYGVKVICDSAGAFIATNNFTNNQTQGDYQNGGSWFLYEYLAYYAAVFHRYANAQALINTRINIEFSVDPVFHEYLQTLNTLPQYGSELASRHVYAWDAASYVIKVSDNQATYSFGSKREERF